MKNTDLVLTLGQRLSLLACIFIVCYVLTAGMAYMLGRVITENASAAIRITTMVQDVMAFVVPAVATACVVTRRPADLLCIRSLKGLWTIPILVAVLILSIPAQEALIEWNNNISLPSEAENFFRSLEDAAASSMRLLIADTSVPSLIMNILIIGLAAGFSEELLFRGCFQRLLVTGGVNVHVAIWTVAAVFSALHLQAYGFVPRMLLGGYFGYLLLWTRSIWAPITAHVLNNTIFVVSAWIELRRNPEALISDSVVEFPAYAWLVSGVVTAAALYVLHRYCRRTGAGELS